MSQLKIKYARLRPIDVLVKFEPKIYILLLGRPDNIQTLSIYHKLEQSIYFSKK